MPPKYAERRAARSTFPQKTRLTPIFPLIHTPYDDNDLTIYKTNDNHFSPFIHKPQFLKHLTPARYGKIKATKGFWRSLCE